MNEIILYYWTKYKGHFGQAMEAIKAFEAVDANKLNFFKKDLAQNNIKYITILDENYPDSLKHLKYPPLVIYYKGNVKLLENVNSFSLVGDIDDERNLEIIKNHISNISNEILVTSNYPGVDQKIVEIATMKKIGIIFVAANGLKKPYFATKSIDLSTNLLISQYPPDTNVKYLRLLERNILVSSFAKHLVLLLFKQNSKILNLVMCFLNQGKEIYAYPDNANEKSGNNDIIFDGAKIITSAQDITKLESFSSI